MFLENQKEASLKSKKRIILIGNAPIGLNIIKRIKYSKFVNNSDLVIRMNSATNYNKGTGTKSDIIGIVNVGKPAILFSYKNQIPNSIKSQISEVWFSRPLQKNDLDSLLISKDLSNFILQFQNLTDKPFFAISKKEYFDLENLVTNNHSIRKFEPSSGFCFLYMILKNNIFKDHEKYLLGFTWEGWKGHNWVFEKNYCHELHQNGDIIIL